MLAGLGGRRLSKRLTFMHSSSVANKLSDQNVETIQTIKLTKRSPCRFVVRLGVRLAGPSLQQGAQYI